MINFNFLTEAINHNAPWKVHSIKTDLNWCVENLTNKIEQIDWDDAKRDIARFIKTNELPSIELWNNELFLVRLENYDEKCRKKL